VPLRDGAVPRHRERAGERGRRARAAAPLPEAGAAGRAGGCRAGGQGRQLMAPRMPARSNPRTCGVLEPAC